MATETPTAPDSADPKSHRCSSPQPVGGAGDIPPPRPGAQPHHDPAAEQSLAACAAFSWHAALAIDAALDQVDYFDPRCAAVVHAAVTVQPTAPGETDDPWWREHQVAHLAGVDPLVIEDWARHAPVAYDTAGRLVAVVKATAARRARIGDLLDELGQLGVGVTWRRDG